MALLHHWKSLFSSAQIGFPAFISLSSSAYRFSSKKWQFLDVETEYLKSLNKMSTLIENAINDSNKSTLFPPLISLNLLVVSKLLLWCSAYTAVQVKKKKRKIHAARLENSIVSPWFLTVISWQYRQLMQPRSYSGQEAHRGGCWSGRMFQQKKQIHGP